MNIVAEKRQQTLSEVMANQVIERSAYALKTYAAHYAEYAFMKEPERSVREAGLVLIAIEYRDRAGNTEGTPT